MDDDEFQYHIRHRAYELWVESGRPDGKHLEFWEAAERELKAQRQATPQGSSPDHEAPDVPDDV